LADPKEFGTGELRQTWWFLREILKVLKEILTQVKRIP